MRRATWLLACVLGCANVRPPQPHVGTVDARSFAPQDEPALQYNATPTNDCPDSVLAGRLFAMVARRAAESHKITPQPDGRLCRVAASLTTLMLEGAPPPQPAVEFALSRAGIVEPVPHFMVLVGNPAGVDLMVREFESRLFDLPTQSARPRMGVGIASRPDGAAVVGLILQDSFVDLAPVPRAVPIGKAAPLTGKLLSPFRSPTLFITAPNGRVQELPPAGEGRDFAASLSCEQAGRLQVEIMGQGAVGPTVLANFPVWCGVAPPKSLALGPVAALVTDPAAAEREIFALANADRRRAGLKALAWHEAAAAVARAHSLEMRDKAFVAHVSPTTGDVGMRMRRAGIATPLTLENLARAYSPADVHSGLMNSPGHRQNLLSSDVTHLGVGVALDVEGGKAPALYVTQVFLRELGPRDLEAERRKARTAVAQRRQEHRKSPLKADGALDQVAQAFADELAKAGGEMPESRRQKLLGAAPKRFPSLAALVSITADGQEAARDRAVLDDAAALGIGIAQGKHRELGNHALFIVVILGR